MYINKINNFLRTKIRKKQRVYISKIENGYLITDGYVMFYLNEEQMELNPNKFNCEKDLNEIWIKSLSENDIEITIDSWIRKHGKFLCKMQNKETKENVYINDEYLKYFLNGVKFNISKNDRSNILVKDGQTPIAILLPVVNVED